MKTVIFINAINNFQYDLRALKQANTRYSLVTTPDMEQQLSANNRAFFDNIHVIDAITFEATSAVISAYYPETSTLTLVTNNERCTPIVASLCDYFKAKGTSANEITRFIDKLAMKNALDDAHIRTPHHMHFDIDRYQDEQAEYLQLIENKIKYPIIAKPVSLYGAASITLIASRDEFVTWANSVSHSHIEFEVEEYIEGILYHCDSLVQDSKVIYTAIGENSWPILRFKDGYPIGSIWLPPSHARWQALNQFNQQILACLNPPDGATHCEIFVTPANEMIFLEVGARAPGGMITPMTEKITGVNFELEHYKARLGIPCTIHENSLSDYFAWAYLAKKVGKVTQLQVPNFHSHCEIDWYIKPGDEIPPSTLEEAEAVFMPSQRAALVVLKNSNFSELYEDYQTLRHASFFEVE